jgi:Spy/CpxP family protein refolding chaperone
MLKLKAFAVVAVAAFAATSAFAGDKAHCAGMTAGNDGKMACASYANLNLTAEQKAKMDAIAAECHKGGMNEATMAKMDKEAKSILTSEQYASWKSAHKKDEKKSEKTQS